MKKQHFVKALVCSLALCTFFSLSGCGNSDSKESSNQTDISTTINFPDTSSNNLDHTIGEIIACGECGENGDNVTWELDKNGVLAISGRWDMKDYGDDDNKYAPWYKRRLSVKTVIINDGVTSIGEGAFSSCTNLTKITIPNSVSFIGMRAFSECKNLKSVTIPDNVASIGYETFYNCTSISSLTIPENIQMILSRAFSGWTSSQTIYIKGISSAPSEWDFAWNYDCNAKIVWNS